MADLYKALRNAHEAGDTEAATRIAGMIKSQQTEQAPTGAATQPQEETPFYEQAFNAAGNVAASGGRMIAGAVKDLANVGVGAGNAVLSAADWATGDNVINYRIPEAGYGAADQYLAPRGTGEQLVASSVPYMVGGEVAAPIKAAENAGRLARAGTAVLNQLPSAVVGDLSEHNQGNLSGTNIAVNAALPSVVEKVGGAAVRGVRNVLPENYGGYSLDQKAAEVVDPSYLNDVLQGGNTEGQRTFRTATTDAEGNSILNPSQVFNTDRGAKYIRAEQRDLTRGDQAYYAPNIEAQKSGESVERAIDEVPSTGNGLGVQETAQKLQEVHKQRVNQLYNDNREAAQNILDNAPVKITELKFPESKQIATDHIAKDTANGKVNLTGEARRTLNSFNNAKMKSLSDIDQWKRTLSEKAQKAYRNGDYSSYQALNQVKNNLRNEADDVISSIDPNAGSIYDDADRYFAGTVEGYGKKSELQKILNSEFGETAANKLFAKDTGGLRTAKLFSQLERAKGSTFTAADQYTNDLASAIGDEGRNRAYNFATTGENFSPTKFYNRMNQHDTTSGIINDISPRSEDAINDALMNAASRYKPSNAATVGKGVTPTTATVLGGTVGSGIGAVLGHATGGALGASLVSPIAGAAGAYISRNVSQGLIDRLAGTNVRATKYLNFLSDPANAQTVSDILANQGGLNASTEAIKRTIDALTQSGYASLNNSTVHPTYTAPAPLEPDQHAQVARIPETSPQAVQGATFEPKVTKLYKALAHAETGGLQDRFIRTKAAEAGTSTAYGAAQLTVTTAKDFYKRHSDIFTPDEKDYLHRFFEQGETMKRAANNDPVFGYGGSGVLNGKEDRKLYAHVVRKMLQQMIKDNGGSLDKTVEQWRGNKNDHAYFSKVLNAYKAV